MNAGLIRGIRLIRREKADDARIGAFKRPAFWAGMIVWAAGFVGNVVHDEILLNLRRKRQTTDAKHKKDDDASKSGNENRTSEKGKEDEKGEHYAIPHGLLYTYVSFPNYLCEWAEWAGFALAASPLPSFTISSSPIASILSSLSLSSLAHSLYPTAFVGTTPAGGVAPPYLFLFAEVITMLPRAMRGHRWYKKRFGEEYPKERRAVVPFVL